LRLLRNKEFYNSTYQKRYLDRLNRALGQADMFGLRAVRPAGAVQLPVVAGRAPLLLPLLVQTPAQGLAGETVALPITHPEVRGTAAATSSQVESVPFAALERIPSLPVELLLRVEVDSVRTWAGGVESLAAVKTFLPSASVTGGGTNAEAAEPIDDPLETPYSETNPHNEVDLHPSEFSCRLLQIAPALQSECTRRVIPRVLPELPFDKIDNETARPFFANAPKAENRRWGGRYIELAAAAIVLAAVLATGLHIARRAGTETPNVRRDAVALSVNAAAAR
jgi:hypothetical protein